MKRFLLIISLSVVAAVVQAQQIKMPKLGKELTSREIVEYLASDALQGRLGGTKGDTLASDFIYAQMKNLRKKLKEAGALIEIKAVYGFGYKLVEI